MKSLWTIVPVALACEASDPATEDGGTSTGGSEAPASTSTATTSPSATAPPGTTSPTRTTDVETTGGEITPPDGPYIRFVALGDGGEGNDAQYMVADQVEQVCAKRGCEFAIYLGDNFYNVGVDSAMDIQFQDKFEMPYADLDFPFYVVLGNHDYGGEILSPDHMKSAYQVEYTRYSDKWTLPHQWYVWTVEHVAFVGLDTARLFFQQSVDEQHELLRRVQSLEDVDYVIAYGHHPYISNGAHGNAGNYDGWALPTVAGTPIKQFFDESVCGKAAVYFSGHDHNRQWHPTTCGTDFIVSGAAAKTKSFVHRDDNPEVLWEDAETPGFAWVEINGPEMTVAFYDANGEMGFEDTIVMQGG